MSARTARVELVAAPAERESTIANLLQLYAHDFSEYIELEIGDDGRFGYKHLSLYWGSAERQPFLIEVDGAVAGFVLIQRGSQVSGDADVWDVAEFFVLRGYRRRRVGVTAARELWRRLPDRWEVRVISTNRAAVEFWRRAISECVGRSVESSHFVKNGADWHLFAFDVVPIDRRVER